MMCTQERLALFTFLVFSATTIACAIVLLGGLGPWMWEERHAYLLSLSLTAVAYVMRLVYGKALKSRSTEGICVDERDREIHFRARGLSLKVGVVILLLGSMAVFVSGTYGDAQPTRLAPILLVVLVSSLALMLVQSAATLVFYRDQR